MNFIFISPQFPHTYWNFCDRLKRNGVNVLGIGDSPYDSLEDCLKNSLTEYYKVDSLENYDEVFRAVAFFSFKYGKIDWLESNNEYWLEQDARLRTDFHITTGIQYDRIGSFKHKSAMKENYRKAGVPSARCHLADHRADEAEKVLERLCRLEDSNPILNEVYRAHIALARFDEPTADQIIEGLLAAHPDDSVCLFEAAQYYAKKAEYDKAIELYNASYEIDEKPRFIDALQGIAIIYEIQGKYKEAINTCDRILDNLQNEWNLKEEAAVKEIEREKNRLMNK